MRALVDIPEEIIEDLNALSARAKVSRAEIIRRALREYANNNSPLIDGFGLWAKMPVDGLALQEKLRQEW